MESQPTTNSVPFAIIVAGLIVAGAVLYLGSVARQSSGATVKDSSASLSADYMIAAGDHVLGNPKAPVVIIEYSDFQCPFCKRFHPVMRQVMEIYGKTGQVAWVYRHFPLEQIHPQARPLANISECVAELGGEDAFWTFADTVMGQAKDFDLGDLTTIASATKVDKAKLTACAVAARHNDRVDRDFATGVNDGIGGTPFSFVVAKGGDPLKLAGIYSFADMKGMLDPIIAAEEQAR